MVQRIVTPRPCTGSSCIGSSIAHLLVLRVMLGVFSGFGAISVALVTHGVPKDKIGGSSGRCNRCRS
jgi:hypothetical protein